MSATASELSIPTRSVVTALLPIMVVVLVAFLVTGVALPVLPLHVHQGLGLGAFVVGLVAGSQFVASLASRVWAGQFADGRGARHAVLAGLLAAIAGGYFTSCRSASSAHPWCPSPYFCLAARSLVPPRASSSRVR
jgi:MFS family permease